MPVLSLACLLPHNTPNIPSRYNNEQTTKQTKAINNSYIYIYISCKCDTNRAGHFTLDAYASKPVACRIWNAFIKFSPRKTNPTPFQSMRERPRRPYWLQILDLPLIWSIIAYKYHPCRMTLPPCCSSLVHVIHIPEKKPTLLCFLPHCKTPVRSKNNKQLDNKLFVVQSNALQKI